jgi:hypothetical protein
LRLSFVKLGYFEVLVNISFINLYDNFCVLIHHLVGLSNNKGFVSLTSKNQEFDGFLFRTLSFTVISYHLCTLRQLTF